MVQREVGPIVRGFLRRLWLPIVVDIVLVLAILLAVR